MSHITCLPTEASATACCQKLQRWRKEGRVFPMRLRRGQLMLMTVLILGGTMLGATTIAGLITTYRLQQAGRARDSAMAIFAADAGLETGFYQCFKLNDCVTEIPGTLPNGASYDVTFSVTDPSNPGGEIRSVGKAGTATRALRFVY